jgi:electron transport complex protein RnfG
LKGRVATLDEFTADAFQGDMGITSPLRPTEPANPDGPKDVVIYVGTSGTGGATVVDGYAVVVDEVGQHEPITFGVLTDKDGRVVRIEVMAYREAYGAEVRSQRFLRQYQGRTLTDLDQPSGDVDAISGATISCNSTRRAVKRALQQIELLRATPTPKPTTPPGTP